LLHNFLLKKRKIIKYNLILCQFQTVPKEKRNIVFIGNPGTGKTHLAIAIGIKALVKNFKVLYTSVAEMLHSLNASKADNSYYQKVNFYLKFDLLILDELGFKKLLNDRDESNLITTFIEPEGFNFELFHDKLKEKGFVIYPGKLLDKNTFRVGNIGNIDIEDIIKFIRAVKEVLNGK